MFQPGKSLQPRSDRQDAKSHVAACVADFDQAEDPSIFHRVACRYLANNNICTVTVVKGFALFAGAGEQ
jgi:hypothetical protein